MKYRFTVDVEMKKELSDKEKYDFVVFIADALDVGEFSLYKNFPSVTHHFVEYCEPVELKDQKVAEVEITGKDFACDPGWRPKKCTD